MIELKSKAEIGKIAESCRIVAKALKMVEEIIEERLAALRLPGRDNRGDTRRAAAPPKNQKRLSTQWTEA